MTKEEALCKFTFGITDYVGYWPEEPVELAMDFYAKQQAMAFANYVMNDYKLSLHPESPILTDEEIYNQFIEQQNKP